ncbi:hypothetical protein FRC00_001924 [Tulasnella sp. 408]|nr:hypothetical protein FRC00_001924 [Tulasnella sp. 408]
MIPVHLHHHWTYLDIDLINWSCVYFDSLDPDHLITPDGVLELVDWWLASVLPSSFGEGLSEEDGRDFDADQQTDTHSCGIAVLSTMAHVALGSKAWSQERSKSHRETWMGAILMAVTPLPLHPSTLILRKLSTPTSAPSSLHIYHLHLHLLKSKQSLVLLPPPPCPAIPSSELQASVSKPSPPDGANPTLQIPMQAISELRQTKLSYPKIDREKWLEIQQAKPKRSREEIEEARERRKYEREKKRNYRKRIVEEEIGSGIRNADGKKRKIVPLQLHYPESLTLSTASMPDATRPYREVRAHDHDRTKKNCGRKPSKVAQPAHRMRWLNRIVFSQIDTAAHQVGYPYSPKEIVRRLKAQSPDLFAKLHPQCISDWRDPKFPDRLVWRPWVMEALENGDVPKKKASCKYILDDYPQLVSAIRNNLKKMRAAGIPLDLTTIRGMMIAQINRDMPEVFKRETAAGRVFQCSPSFVRRFIRKRLCWSFRRATKAAQATPQNAAEVTKRAFLRMTCTIQDEQIPADLVINADQTQVVLVQGTKASYAETGSKQVDVVGQTEKRAFTLMLSVLQSGEALPFQAIYTGKDPQRSLPKPTSSAYSELILLGHRFEVSQTSNYWATQTTMRGYITHIAVPYFKRKIEELGLPKNQRCIQYLDVWSVHRSAKFQNWLKRTYPWVILQYCPGGCTSLFQPCDANLNRLAKEAIHRAALDDIIRETTGQLERGSPAESIILDKTIGMLRDRTPGWLLAAWKAVNQRDRVLKSWELCATGDFNLSYESLTSRVARQAILDMRSTDPSFFAEITSGTIEEPGEAATYSEDEERSEVEDEESGSEVSDDDFFKFEEDDVWPEDAEESGGDGDVDRDALMADPPWPVRECVKKGQGTVAEWLTGYQADDGSDFEE